MTTQRVKSSRFCACLLTISINVMFTGCDRDEGPSAPKGSEVPLGAPDDTSVAETPTKVLTPFHVPDADVSGLAGLIRSDVAEARGQAISAPDDVQAVGKLGMVYYVSDLSDAAIVCFDRCRELEPEGIRWFYYSGLAHDKSGNTREAVRAFEKTIELSASYNAALVALADVLRENDVKRAANLYRQAIEADHGSARAHFGLGLCEKQQQNNDQAIEHLRLAVDLVPGYAEAHGVLAELLTEAGNSDEAAEHLKRQEYGREPPWTSDPLRSDMLRYKRVPTAMAKRAVALAKDGKNDEAFALLANALEIDPSEARVRETYASLLGASGRTEEAVKEYRRVLEAHPDSDPAKAGLGEELVKLGQYDEAERLHREILEKFPRSPVIIERLVSIKNLQGKPADGITVLEGATKLWPENAALRKRLGEMYFRIGRVPEAIEALQESVRLAPTDSVTQQVLGDLLFINGDLDAAKRAFILAIRLDPTLANPYVKVAAIARQEKNFRAAMQFLADGLRMTPDSPELANSMAWALATSPDPELRNGPGAVRYAEQAANSEAFVGNPSFLDTLAAAYAEAGRFEEAVATMLKAIEGADKAGRSPEAIGEYRKRLALYESGQPYHEE